MISPRVTLLDLCIYLKSILQIKIDQFWENIVISQIVTRHEMVSRECVFVAIKGTQYNTHKDLARIISLKPAAIVYDIHDPYGKMVDRSNEVVFLPVSNSRRALALMATCFWGDPSQDLFTVGVTGTNGKTSVTTMIEYLLTQMKIKTAKIGTLGLFIDGQKFPTQNTTPGPLELNEFLHYVKLQKGEAVSMEVSSHALDQYRVDGIHFNSVVFTNLTRDHLDYHLTMERYFQAKARLFSEILYHSLKKPKTAIINIDDRWAKNLQIDSQAFTITYGQEKTADLFYQIDGFDLNGVEFTVNYAYHKWKGYLPLVGTFQVGNFLASYGSLINFGFLDFQKAIHLIADFPGVPGRMERVKEVKEFHLFIDYAHSPDALENTLRYLREAHGAFKSGSRLGLVFGCGGERDQGKRSLMGSVAEKYCDWIVITSDNPRKEDPQKIVFDILQGIQDQNKVIIEIDRERAILKALNQLKPHDVLVIAGKGHETYQEIGNEKINFSDYQVVIRNYQSY